MVKKDAERLRLKLKRVGRNVWTPENASPVSTPTSTSFEHPQAKKPCHRGHIPNGNHDRPLTPASKSPSSSYNGSPSYIHSPNFPLDGILTPQSISPNETNEIDQIDQITNTIVNWDAERIMDPRYQTAPYHTNVIPVPDASYQTFDYYQKCVSLLFHWNYY